MAIESSGEDNILTEQEPLFSLEVVNYKPAMGTAHLRNTVIATDGLEYAIKGINDGDNSTLKGIPYPRQIPASEWLCTKMAEYSGIATPTCRVIKDTETGEFFFGSRYDLAASGTPDDQMKFVEALTNNSPILRKQIWGIYAFDQFVFNIDRHLNNYLYTTNRSGDTTVQAFDFSLAALVMGWPNKTEDNLLPENTHTSSNWKIISHLTSFDNSCRESALAVLEKLSNIKTDFIDRSFNEMPGSWINPLQKEALVSWWASDNRLKRINRVKMEVMK